MARRTGHEGWVALVPLTLTSSDSALSKDPLRAFAFSALCGERVHILPRIVNEDHTREAGRSATTARAGASGRRQEAYRVAAQEGQAHRPRADRPVARPWHLPRA